MSEELIDSQSSNQTIIIQEKKTNGIGIAGFVLSILSLFLGWIPFLGWLIWIVGLILSFVGVFKSPRGFAIAGLIISLIGIILIIVVFGGALAMAATTHS